MSTAAHVWEDGAREPEGLFDPAAAPNAPVNWFREEPEYAAELFALELFCDRRSHADSADVTYGIWVRDDAGKITRFGVRVRREISAAVTTRNVHDGDQP